MDITVTSDLSVELIDCMGDDSRIVAAARVSTKGTRAEDESAPGLINYLMKNRHGTPFEHGSMTFRVSAPIFVFREWHRHRVGWSYNEESGRYKQLEPKFYIPSAARKIRQTGKPGHYTYETGTYKDYLLVYDSILDACCRAYENYSAMLDEGIAREVARMCLPVNIFSTMYATCNPRSLMHFLGLRTQHEEAKFPSFPMHEISMAADIMEHYFYQLYPITSTAWHENGRVAP